MEAPSDRDADIARLRAYELALLVVLVAHVADHVRQGRPTTTSIGLLGVLSFAGVVVASALALLRHRWAGPAAVLIGIGTATGLVAVHVLPRWSFLSDSFVGSGVDALSWAILAAYALIALATAAAGVRVARLRRVPLPTYGRAMVDGAHVRSDRGYAPWSRRCESTNPSPERTVPRCSALLASAPHQASGAAVRLRRRSGRGERPS